MDYKTSEEQAGLFDYLERCRQLAQESTGLDRLNTAVDWERFRGTLEHHLAYADGSKGGRPAWDPVLMFQVLVLQKFYGLSDEQAEFQIKDRFSFQRFLGLDVRDRVPDQKTIWVFKERLGQEGMRALFDLFNGELAARGLCGTQGKIVDASFVEAPRQRNSPKDNARIKAGERPAHFDNNLHSARQKDTDARWVQQGSATHFGYKNHAKVDVTSKLVEDYRVTDASVHDSQVLHEMVKPGDKTIYADSAYAGQPIAEVLHKHRLTNSIHAKAQRGWPLRSSVRMLNRLKSRIRCRVEHVFGRLAQMRADWFRRRGRERAGFEIGLANLVYNLYRFAYLVNAG